MERPDINKRHALTLARLLPVVVEHSTQNWHRLVDVDGWEDLYKLKDKYKNVPIVCVASGPTLRSHLSKVAKDDLIFCSHSHGELLKEVGLDADFALALDPGSTVVDHVKNFTKKTQWITWPGVMPAVIDEMKGGYIYLESNPGSNFHDAVLPNMYPGVAAYLSPFGCSGNGIYDAACYMGFNPIYLAGYDYGMEDRPKAPWRAYTEQEIAQGKVKYVEEYPYPVIPSNARGWVMDKAQMDYKVGLYINILKRKRPVYRIEDTGTLQEIPIENNTDFDLEPFREYLRSVGYEFSADLGSIKWTGTK